MAENQTWKTLECPFTIECSREVLENIRSAAVDAYYLLPHGGIEIGGVLYGRWKDNRIEILSSRPLECSHSMGPSFVLSEQDREKLAGLLTDAQPVGWYHSHTRSEIALSATDLEIHNRYFPEPWQVALVLRPGNLQPTRAGFFVREPNGRIRSEASYSEFAIEPMALEPEPKRDPRAPVAAAVSTMPPVKLSASAGSGRSLMWVWVVMLLGLGLAAGGFATKDRWMLESPSPVSLQMADSQGQLTIRWDRNARALCEAPGGILEITDGAVQSLVKLDEAKLRLGRFNYARHSERVDARLILKRPNGGTFEEMAGFLGQPLVRKPSREELEARRQRDLLAQEAEQMKIDLRNQAFRTRKLERTVQELNSRLMGVQQTR